MISYTITVNEPAICEQSVTFSWEVDPACDLYTQQHFTLTFPDSVDLSLVPRTLWWRIALTCLHSHWVILRPVRVILPIRLAPGEREFWLRLCDAATWTLEGRVAGSDTRRRIDLVESGARLVEQATPKTKQLAAACFSGGRDSLTQVGLLTELGEPFFLVTTVAPRLGSIEHESPRHREVMSQIVDRCDVELVRVSSDYRSIIDNGFISEQYGMAVTELTDCLLYFSAAAAVAVSRGANMVAMASEFEVQTTKRRDGMVIQHPHFMYSGVTQRALAAAFSPHGIGFSGLTASLRQFQVQRLLALRYPELADLQYSCWSLSEGQGACSSCRECLRNALYLLSDGISPATASIDTATLFRSHPTIDSARPREFHDPGEDLRRSSREQRRRQLERISLHQVSDLVDGDADALAGFAALKAEALASAEDCCAEPGYVAPMLELSEQRVRDGLEAIVGEYFTREDNLEGRQALARTQSLATWISAPLTDPSLDSAARREDAALHARIPGLLPRSPNPEPLTDKELARVAPELPDPEPPLGHAPSGRVLYVADTDLSGNESEYLRQCITDNFISSAGSFIGRFERAFADACGTEHAVSCSSGTAALQLAYAAAGIGPGDEVIMPTFTMIATANAASHLGARPVFVDTDAETWNISLAAVTDAIGPKTRAIVLVHTYGQPIDPRPFRELADRNDLLLIEDAAQAHGAMAFGERVGGLADVAAFSFYGNKILTTGEGGMVTTNSATIAASVRELRDHGFSAERHFWHRLRAYNFRMTNLQAAVGLAQVERLPDALERRRATAASYRSALSRIGGIELAPPSPVGLESVTWMFGLVVADEPGATSGHPTLDLRDRNHVSRDDLRRHLAAEGIETRTFFVPLHLQPSYSREHRGRHRVAERLGRHGLYLPSGPSMRSEDVSRVVESIAEAFGAHESMPIDTLTVGT